ncbi:MAG: S8 family serine peptidase [Candidatus Eisenbacteria bacterium]|nr:S8 family serine peptidase [Candidatus Eisenbacteria bacterium]
MAVLYIEVAILTQQQSGGGYASFVPNQVTVAFKPGVAQSWNIRDWVPFSDFRLRSLSAKRAIEGLGRVEIRSVFPGKSPSDTFLVRKDGTSAKVPDLSRIYTIRFGSHQTPLEVSSHLSSLEGVEAANPNWVGQWAAIQPCDEYFLCQWGLWPEYMNVMGAWDVTMGDTAVRIGVVDSGVWRGHPDLLGKIVPDRGDPGYSWHGTWVGGVAAALTNNTKIPPDPGEPMPCDEPDECPCIGSGCEGIAGAGWNTMLISYFSLPNADNLAAGLVRAADSCDVIVTGLVLLQDVPVLREAVEYVYNYGRVLVVASGNTNQLGDCTPNCTIYPAAYGDSGWVLAVGAIDRDSTRCWWSNYGSFISIVAPGNHIWTTNIPMELAPPGSPGYIPTGTYGSISGTSVAAPYVAGVCALMKAVDPTLTNIEIMHIVKETASHLPKYPGEWNELVGYGMVNAYQAVARAAGTISVSEGRLQRDAGSSNMKPAISVSPNPGRGKTTFTLSLREDWPEDANVELTVYDVRGRFIKTLWEGSLRGAEKTVAWDGLDDGGRPVPVGVYVVKLSSGTLSRSAKTVLLR